MTSDQKPAHVSKQIDPEQRGETSPLLPNQENHTFEFAENAQDQTLIEDSADNTHRKGHRERLRDRVLNGGAQHLADYELLEMLLFAASPRGDTRPIARNLIKEFGSLAGVLSASREKLLKISGVGDAVIATIRVAERLGEKLLRSPLEKRNILSSWQALLEYCQGTMGNKEIEHFRILFLNNRNHMIADEVQQTGTVNQAAVYPREVVKRALELGATSLILVHNHPSGDTSPSKSDIRITEDINNAANALNISIHDHLIVSSSEHTSLRALGIL